MQSTPSSRVLPRVRRALAGALALSFPCAAVGLLAACQSGPSAAELGRTTTTAGRIELETSGRRFVLLSETMLERMGVKGTTPEERTLEFYSTKSQDAAAKVAPDDAIAGLVQFYDGSVFGEQASAGPYQGPAQTHLTVVVGDQVRSMGQPPGGNTTDPQDLVRFIECVQGTLEVYNAIQGRQAVDGVIEFKQPELSDRLKRDAGVGLGGNQGGNR